MWPIRNGLVVLEVLRVLRSLGARKAKICLAPRESGICVGVPGWNERACIQKSPFVGIFTRVQDVFRKFLEVLIAKKLAVS